MASTESTVKHKRARKHQTYQLKSTELRQNDKKAPKLTHKGAAIKPKHAKPYRKRHYTLLVVSLAAAFILFGLLISFNTRVNSGLQDARQFVADNLIRPNVTQRINSAYGFSLSYDSRNLYASAIDGSTGQLYLDKELAASRPYQTIKFSHTAIPSTTKTPDSITVDYYPSATKLTSTDLATIEQHYALLTTDGNQPVAAQSRSVTVNGQVFRRTMWQQTVGSSLGVRFSTQFVTYTTLYKDKPLVIRTNNRLGQNPSMSDIDTLVKTFSPTTSDTVSYQAQTPKVIAQVAHSRSLLNTLSLTQMASAAPATNDNSQDISSQYLPAVTQVFNAYCTDISINGAPYLTGACSAESGSGFFVSGSGYIATNGHVATMNPKDLVVSDAINNLEQGDSEYLMELLSLTHLTSDSLAGMSQNDQLDAMINAIYNIPDSTFSLTNNVQNLLVDLDSKSPDITTLLNDTKNRIEYPGTADIKRATVVASNYRAIDGIAKFHDSDVALMKVDGSHFPNVMLGSLSSISQGSDLSILGFPGEASDNGLVQSNVSSATLTSGKVSAVKNANGDSRKLIETDATIGHGNSGGPVFNDQGQVIGIATYTIDGSGDGNGTYNYIRDIQDFRTLAQKSGVKLNVPSDTQQAWNNAISAFNSSHFSKSLGYFSQVKALYPQQPTLADFVSRAKQNIAEGKNVSDFPVALLGIGAAVALVVAGVAVGLIVRHHAKHQLYNVATGKTAVAPAGQSTASPTSFYYPVQPNTSAPNPYVQSPTLPTAPATQQPAVTVAPSVTVQPQVGTPTSPEALGSQAPQQPQGPIDPPKVG